MTIDAKADIFLERLRAAGCRPRLVRQDKYRCLCPVHKDRRPSVDVTLKADRILLHCFAGCDPQHLLDALDLGWEDLHLGYARRAGQTAPRTRVVAIYAYCDIDGHHLADKVRYEPKSFAWRRNSGERFRWGLDGVRVPLYRLPHLVGARQVILVEGEKAANRLVEAGFVATCPSSGAGHWDPIFEESLCQVGVSELVILSDNDRSGRTHANRVARACATRSPSSTSDRPFTVKLVDVFDVPRGGDIYDWFDRGGDHDGLQRRINETPLWTPDHQEAARRARTREQGRLRQRRFRQRHRETDAHSETAP